MIDDLVDLGKISELPKNQEIFSFLSNYPKFKSVSMMASAGLPVSKSIIVVKNSVVAKRKLERIVGAWQVGEYTIRSEKKFGTVNSRSVQGCKYKDIWSNVLKFFAENLLPMVILQGDVYHNTYSVNILVDPNKYSEYILEIVGHGFCATDINKRDIVNERGILTDGGKLKSSEVVTKKVYKYQIDLMKANIVKKSNDRGRVFQNEDNALQWVDNYLKKINALIINRLSYTPISKKYLEYLWTQIPNILEAGELMGYANEKYIVSMSFVQEVKGENPYFWDIYPYSGYKNRG